MSRTYQLEFFDHRHASGRVNWTVRLGDKWAYRAAAGELGYVLLAHPYQYRKTIAHATAHWLGRLADLPPRVLADWHSGPISFDRLERMLGGFYPGHRIGSATIVTALGYVLHEEKPPPGTGVEPDGG